jgi:tetratricopeptide (TPR) repeat protein
MKTQSSGNRPYFLLKTDHEDNLFAKINVNTGYFTHLIPVNSRVRPESVPKIIIGRSRGAQTFSSMKHIRKISIGFACVFLLSACVTQKKKDDGIGWLKKGYHNLTTKYNYWFNADELLRLTEVKLSASHKDNYNQILDLYPYAATDPASVRADLDNVILKSSKGIALHRPTDWEDDCYIMIGQAQYLKRDFETAENTFKFIRDEYDPKKTARTYFKKGQKKKASTVKKKAPAKKKKKAPAKKKKKKKSSRKKGDKNKEPDEKAAEPDVKKDEAASAEDKKKDQNKDLVLTGDNPYKKSLKRMSAFPMAMIWYGRTLTEREKFDEAEFLFRGLHEDQWFPASLRDELFKAEAYLWIKQKKYDQAIEPLSKAIDLTHKKKERARLAYILAQLYDRSSNHEFAYTALEKVLHSNPPYEMEFNARLRQIQAGWANGKITSADANKGLEKLAKDEKNLDYRDQIYYVMADIALKDGLKKDAIALLRKSLDNNKSNPPQRAESFLKLADLYFELENFVLAKTYYDSTITVLPNTDERFKRANLYAVNLKDIARLIQTIAANDSIVRIFRMNDSERKEFAKGLKKQREAEAEAKSDAAKVAANAAKGSGQAPAQIAGNKPSTFYFYNDAFVKKGKRDFTKVWGDRKLDDNWRRNSRPLAGAGQPNAGDDPANNGTDSLGNKAVSDAEFSDLFKGIPKSEGELSVIHLATYEAMYQLGTLFRDKLQNNKRSTGTLEDLQTRYPDTLKYQKETWYYCYLGFTDLSNAAKAKYYYDKLVNKYPNSSYARALSDPNFSNATKAKVHELNKYYDETYGQFQSGNYKSAYDRCIEAPKQYGSQNPLVAKFALLSALCVGNMQGNEAYCKALGEVIARYPESAEATRAREIARLMSCKGFEVDEKKKPGAPGDESKIDDAFTREDDKLHYFLVVLTGDLRLEDVKGAVSDYNRENHKLDQLRISNIFLGTDTNTPIIVIRKFDSKEQAMRYFNEVKDKKDFLGESAKKTYNKEFFAVTQENYRRILKNKSLDGYRDFFSQNYLK